MSQTLEIPDQVYAALEKAASERGMTPIDWITAHLPPAPDAVHPNGGSDRPRTMADRFAGRVGRVAFDDDESLSEKTGGHFADYVEAKWRARQL